MKYGSHLENGSQCEKCFTFRKIGHTGKTGSHLEKMGHTVKNGSHLEKCFLIGETCHMVKNGSHLE